MLLALALGCGPTAPESTEQDSTPAEEPGDAQAVDASPFESTPEAQKLEQSTQNSQRQRVASPSNPPLAQREPARAPASQVVEKAAAQRAAEPRYVTIPAGTMLQVRLQDPLDTSVNQSGDTFRAILDEALEVGGYVIAARGSMVEGTLSNVERAGRVEGRSKMSLRVVSLLIDAQSYPIESNVLAFEAESTVKKDATKVGLGAGIGAVIGAIAGGGKGAAIGAAVGGGAGGATVIATRGKDLKFEVEQEFSFELQKDVDVRIQ